MTGVRAGRWALLVAAMACGGGEGAGNVASITVDSVPLVTIGVQEGEEPYQLHRVVDAYRHADGRVVVSNSGSLELRIYDSTGLYLGALGRQGAGPAEFAEFSAPRMFTRDGQMVVTDDGAARAHVIDDALRFVETRRFTLDDANPRPFLRGVLADGDWVAMAFADGGALRGQPGQLLASRYALLRYDSTGTIEDTIVVLPGPPRVVNEHEGRVHFPYLPLASAPEFAVDGDRVIVASGVAPALRILDASGELRAEVTFERPMRKAAEIWDAYRVASLAQMQGADSARYAAYYAKPLPLPENAPMYVGVKVDAARRIWLERFRMPGATGPREWDVLTPDGALIGLVTTPGDLTVYRIGMDHVIGRARDSLGVERVRVHRLR
jgi:hypothetical protein